jgi:hypothetical protein
MPTLLATCALCAVAITLFCVTLRFLWQGGTIAGSCNVLLLQQPASVQLHVVANFETGIVTFRQQSSPPATRTCGLSPTPPPQDVLTISLRTGAVAVYKPGLEKVMHLSAHERAFIDEVNAKVRPQPQSPSTCFSCCLTGKCWHIRSASQCALYRRSDVLPVNVITQQL